jgi:hypothetical protein
MSLYIQELNAAVATTPMKSIPPWPLPRTERILIKGKVATIVAERMICSNERRRGESAEALDRHLASFGR